jgi:regulator of nonsense transcripts 1
LSRGDIVLPNSSESKIWDGYDFSALELLLAGDNIAMSEFEAIRLALRWFNRHHTPIDDFLHLFDFNAVSAEEKAWILAQLPPSSHTPSLVLNALCSSHLLQEDELRQFNLQHPGIRWQRLYSSSWERQAVFLDRAARALQLFHRKLIVFRVDDRLTLAIYVPRKVEPSQDCVVDDRVRVFAFPHSQGPETQSRLVLPTKKNYRLYCDENSLQLFENQRANTWIFITRGPSDDSLYRSTEDRGDRRRQRQSTIDSGLNIDNGASIALNKFSNGLQRHVGRVNRNGISASVR